MEDRLKSLMSAGSKENRTRWVRAWQGNGKKVIGIVESLVPEEVIYAADMLPWRIQGTWREDVSLATRYRLVKSCTFLSHVLQSVLEGELDFLDGMVCSDRDEDFMRFWDTWESLGKVRLAYLLEVPIVESKLTQLRFAAEIRNLIAVLETFGQVRIDDDSLRRAIAVYDQGRALLRKVYELRKREAPPLSGGEVLSITTAATVMPRDVFNKELEALLPYLEQRKANISHTKPRLLLTTDLLDNPAYIDLIEKAGCLVAMDDMDTGSRYFWETVDGKGEDPAYALAERYLKNRLPRMLDWDKQAELIVQWVKEFNIDGVLEMPDMYDYPRSLRRLFLQRRLKQEGIPDASFERDYCLTNPGQLSTRVQAFLEMMESKSAK
jgi:benzoyl-CoA reductase subunit C